MRFVTPRRALAELSRISDEHGERLAWVLIVVFTLPYVWLVRSVEFLPMQDLPGHMELAFLFDRVVSGDPAYTPFYRVAPQPWPNSLSTVLLAFFGKVIGFSAGTKLLLAGYLVTWPLTLGLLAKQLGRSPALALLAIPAGVDFNWSVGFLNYLLGKPLAVAAVAMAIAFAQRPAMVRGLAVAALLALTYLGHALAWLVAMGGAGLALVVFSRSWRRLLNLWPLLPACFLPWRYLRAQPGSEDEWTMYGIRNAVSHAWDHLGDLGTSTGEEWAYGICFAVWLWALVSRNRALASGSAEARRGSVFLGVSVLGLLGVYTWGPAHLPNVAVVCVRLLVFAWAWMLLLPLALPTGWKRAAALGAVALAIGLHVTSTHMQYRRFNRHEMKGFAALAGKIPPGLALATYYTRGTSKYAKHQAMWHWPKFYTVWAGGGGRTNDTFAWRSTSYVTLTHRALKAGTHQGRPGLIGSSLAPWDYLLVHGGPPSIIAAAVQSFADPVGMGSGWQLFRLRHQKRSPETSRVAPETEPD